MSLSVRGHAWQWGAAAALALVLGIAVVAGGFDEVATAEVREVSAGDEFELGPFRVELGDAVVVPDRDAYVDDGERRPQLVLVPVDITVSGDVTVKTSALEGQVVPVAGLEPLEGDDTLPTAQVKGRADGVSVYELSPGLTYGLVLAWEQPPDWDGDEVTIDFQRLRWVEEDHMHLDDQRWMATSEVGFRATLPVTRGDGGES